MTLRNAFFSETVVLRYHYQGESYPKREFELIDRYRARLKLKMFKNREKISENLTGLHALVRATELLIDELKDLLIPVNLRR